MKKEKVLFARISEIQILSKPKIFCALPIIYTQSPFAQFVFVRLMLMM